MKKLHRLSKRLHFGFDMTNQIYKLIAEIESLNSNFRIFGKLSHQTIKRLSQSVIITSSGASNRIEGNKLNDEEVEKIFQKMRIKDFKTRDEQEVVGYIELLELIFSSYNDIKFTEGIVLQFHDMLLKYTEKDLWHKGKYKFGYNKVEARDADGNLLEVVFDPTEPAFVLNEMKILVEWTQEELKKKEIHPLLVIANFIFEYLAIHPFQDGNGRTSRLLTNLLFLQQGYLFMPFVSHEALIEQKKVEYYMALNKAQKTWKTQKEDISSWILFFLQIVKQQLTQSIKISTKENIEPYLSKYQLKVWNTIIEFGEISPKQLQQKTNISPNTIKQITQKLIHMQKIERIGQTRGVRYRLKK